MRRVAVTGIGIVCPLGGDAEAFLESLAAGRSGIARWTGRDHERLASPVAAAASFDASRHFDAPSARMLDRVSQFALVAAGHAIAQAGPFLEGLDQARVGAFVGTAMGGSQATDDGYRTLYAERSDRLKPFSVLLAMANAPAAWIGLEHGLLGPNLTYTTACSSSAVSARRRGASRSRTRAWRRGRSAM